MEYPWARRHAYRRPCAGRTRRTGHGRHAGSDRPGTAGPAKSRSPATVLVIGAGPGAVVRSIGVPAAVAAFGAEQLLELVQQVRQQVPGNHDPAVAHRYPGLPETEAGIPPDHHARIPRAELAQTP